VGRVWQDNQDKKIEPLPPAHVLKNIDALLCSVYADNALAVENNPWVGIGTMGYIDRQVQATDHGEYWKDEKTGRWIGKNEMRVDQIDLRKQGALVSIKPHTQAPERSQDVWAYPYSVVSDTDAVIIGVQTVSLTKDTIATFILDKTKGWLIHTYSFRRQDQLVPHALDTRGILYTCVEQREQVVK
jgi:hypothetical protein